MATDSGTPPTSRPARRGQLFMRVVLPGIFTLVGLLALITAGIALVVKYVATQGTDKQIVARRFEEATSLFGMPLDPRYWLIALIPLMLAGFFYAAWMYVRDGRSIGWAWATFLGLLRCSIYLILAFVFLLPATQTWDETHTQSRVLIVLDASLSMLTKDDIPTPEMPYSKLPTRQDRVVEFVAGDDVKFLPRLLDKNPTYAYRFGRFLDADYHLFLKGKDNGHMHWTRAELERKQRGEKGENDTPIQPAVEQWARSHWVDFLGPKLREALPDNLTDEERKQRLAEMEKNERLFQTTNLGDPLLDLLNREGNNMLQGIVVFSDGRTTEGAMQSLREVAERAKKAKIPIFVVGIGEDRPKTRIEIADVRAPKQVRPEDKFPVVVEVRGEGLADQVCPITLELARVVTKDGKDVETELTLVEVKTNGDPVGEIVLPRRLTLTPPADPPLKFKPGNIPQARHEFLIDAATLAKAAGKEVSDPANKIAFKDDKEGDVRLIASVPKHKNEIYPDPTHKSDPVKVKVQKRPLRVLLFAGGPMHEYQFVRTQLVREMDKQRAEICIYVQPATPGQPPRTGVVADVPPERLLKSFPHLMIDEKDSSVKPDEKFLTLMGYDLIIAFDPDWTQLSQQQLENVNKWVGNLGGGLIAIGGPVNSVQLARPGANKEKLKPILDIYPVILKDNRIDEIERSKTEPWRLNFPGVTPDLNFMQLDDDAGNADMLGAWRDFFHGKGAPGGDKAPVIRGFFDYYPVKEAKPAAQVIATYADPRSKLEDGKEQPYFVLMPFGSGKTFWIGSGEIRRLRGFHEAFYERFWTKLSRYIGAGSVNQNNRRVNLLMGRKFPANEYFQVEAKIYGKDMKPLDERFRPKVTLTLPQGVQEKDMPARYEMTPKAGGGSEFDGQFVTRILAKVPGNYGLELKVDETGDVESYKFQIMETNPELDNTRPDYESLYDLASEADDVLSRVDETTRKNLKSKLSRPRVVPAPGDKPPEAEKPAVAAGADDKPRLFFDLKTASIIPDCMVKEEKHQRSRGPVEDWWHNDWPFERPEGERWFSWAAALAVGLFSIEWLTRKLLRLA